MSKSKRQDRRPPPPPGGSGTLPPPPAADAPLTNEQFAAAVLGEAKSHGIVGDGGASELAAPREGGWQYLRGWIADANFDARAAELGAAGWELVGTHEKTTHGSPPGGGAPVYTPGWVCFWKRRRTEP